LTTLHLCPPLPPDHPFDSREEGILKATWLEIVEEAARFKQKGRSGTVNGLRIQHGKLRGFSKTVTMDVPGEEG
jgi:hypothetical protein